MRSKWTSRKFWLAIIGQAVGDSAVYHAGDKLISHQIVKIDVDEQGRRYTFRGRNTLNHDPYIVRNEHIKYLLVGVIF